MENFYTVCQLQALMYIKSWYDEIVKKSHDPISNAPTTGINTFWVLPDMVHDLHKFDSILKNNFRGHFTMLLNTQIWLFCTDFENFTQICRQLFFGIGLRKQLLNKNYIIEMPLPVMKI